MRRNLVLASLLSISLVGIAHGQEGSNKATPNTSSAPAIVITPKSTPADLARAALQAQGGEKFRSLQNLTLRGSVQLYAPNSVQGIPGSFSITVAGDKLRMDLDGRPIVFFKQISDGQNTFSSMPGVEVPPVSKYGMGALLRYDQPGYKLTAIPDVKKQRGFRLEDPEGYTTDF